jgi:hypothetical protein
MRKARIAPGLFAFGGFFPLSRLKDDPYFGEIGHMARAGTKVVEALR